MRLWLAGGLAIALGGVIAMAVPAACGATTLTGSAVPNFATSHSSVVAPFQWLRGATPNARPTAPMAAFPRAAVAQPASRAVTAKIPPRVFARLGFEAGNISCVPFARNASGIDLQGNASEWWSNAAGLYDRGSRPKPGSVLNFRATDRMPLGHVAFVAATLNSRLITIDHANWGGGGGGVARGVPVMDVSPNNDWTQVRLGLDHDGAFGSVYPTYGFIYARPS